MKFLIFTLAVCLAGAPLGYLQQALGLGGILNGRDRCRYGWNSTDGDFAMFFLPADLEML